MIGLVIQARYGSSRLRGKLLMPLGQNKGVRKGAQSTTLDCVAQNALLVKGIDVVCFAVADDDASDCIAEHLQKNYSDIVVARGDQHDVLARYYHAAKQLKLDAVMRITSDCPFFDPALASDMVAVWHENTFDFLTNNHVASFPHGVDAEIIRFDALTQAHQQAILPAEREHVTPYIRSNQHFKRACLVNKNSDENTIAQRWTLDYPEDYQFLDGLMQLLAEHNSREHNSQENNFCANADFNTIIKLLKTQSDLYKLNQMHHVNRELASGQDDDGWVLACFSRNADL